MSESITLAIRERKACPVCKSLQVIRRARIGGYRCGNCGWTGKDHGIVKKAIRQDPPTAPGNRDGHVNRKYAVGLACHERVSDERIARIRTIKNENPDASQRMIAMLAHDTEYAVQKALKDHTPQVIAE